MYNRHLSTFLKVAEFKSFSKAGEHLYISASAVIQQINALERDLGVTLFSRSRRGLHLTAAGKYLAAEAQEFIQRGDQIRSRLLELDSQKPCIVVGTTMEEKCRLLYDLWILFTPGKDPALLVGPETDGYAREVVSKLQAMRKDAGFDVTDRITVTVQGDQAVLDAVQAYRDMITNGVLAVALTFDAAPADAFAGEKDINGKKAVLSVKKA